MDNNRIGNKHSLMYMYNSNVHVLIQFTIIIIGGHKTIIIIKLLLANQSVEYLCQTVNGYTNLTINRFWFMSCSIIRRISKTFNIIGL